MKSKWGEVLMKECDNEDDEYSGFKIMTDVTHHDITDDEIEVLHTECNDCIAKGKRVHGALFCVIWLQALLLAIRKCKVDKVHGLLAKYPDIVEWMDTRGVADVVAVKTEFKKAIIIAVSFLSSSGADTSNFTTYF